jgi:hypothetical protein
MSTPKKRFKPNDEEKSNVTDGAKTRQRQQLDWLMEHIDRPVKIPKRQADVGIKEYEPPAMVQHVQGSSQGAGSADFHIYRAQRRREMDRLKTLDKDVEQVIFTGVLAKYFRNKNDC